MAGGCGSAQTPPANETGATSKAAAEAPASEKDRAEAYYNFTLGHMYAELAGSYGSRGDYATKAIEYYRAAMRLDPRTSFLADELADLYLQTQKIADAVSEYQGALKKNPNDITARRILGRIYIRMIGDSTQNRVNEKMLSQAIEQYSKIVELQPDDTDTWLMLGRLYKIAQNSPESEKAYKKVLAQDPDNEDALTGLAMVYSDLGDTRNAMEVLKKVAERKPDLRTLTALAASYEQLREYGLAAQTLQRALELQPGNSELERSLAQNLMFSQQYDAALKTYQTLAKEDPRDFVPWLRISQIYRQQRNLAKSREASDKARQLEPNNLEIRYNEVNLLEAEGKTKEALALMQQILDSTARHSYSQAERENRVALLEKLGLMYRIDEQYDQAAEAFRQISAVDPQLAARSEAQVVDTYRMGREFTKAEQAYDAAVKKFPTDRVLKTVWANLLSDTGRNKEAAEQMKAMLDGKNDRDTWLSLAQIYEKSRDYGGMANSIDQAEKLSNSKDEKEAVLFMRGAMYEKQKKFDAAEEQFRKVINLNPQNASALNYLGYMFADRNVRLQEAHELISKALDQDPNNGAFLDSLGWVYYRQGKLDDAERALVRALERVSKDPTVHDHLGDVYFHQGKIKDAITQWEFSLKEWQQTPPVDREVSEMAKVQKKLEGARVRLARENSTVRDNKQ
ncbi:MAG: tetratricopeptide repeat protein [Bryobacterales bacterium]|nr:tetratricopeptide repeat protein [Bryobacterales bacterium]